MPRIQGFGYEQETVEPVSKTQSPSDPKRHSRIAIADNSSDDRAQGESNPKRSADESEGAGPFFFRCDIRDICKRRRAGRASDARNTAANKHPTEWRRYCHDHVIQAEAESRKQQHRTAPKPVRQNTDHRRKEKLHGGKDGEKNSVPDRGARHVVVHEI